MKAAGLFLFAALAAAQSWVLQSSGTTVALRGVSAVSATAAWASGAHGTYRRTTAGGATWRAGVVPGAANLDFYGVRALDEDTAYLLSSGPGELSRIYMTTDAGANWHLLQINPNPKGVWKVIAMWDPTHGIVVSDPVNGRFVIYTTFDGGSWAAQKGPQAEAGAAATCLFVRGEHDAWFAAGARVFHSDDDGKTWSMSKTALPGILSLAFSDPRHAVAVGENGAALSEDGGKNWAAAQSNGHSAVAYLAERKMWIATGAAGSDVSLDGGKSWKQFDPAAYNALSLAGGTGWAVGPGGIGKLSTD